MMSSTAPISADLAGWSKGGGRRRTPFPTLIFLVFWATAERKTSGAEEIEYPSKKWCSTSQTWWKPSSSARQICSSACQ